MKKFSRILAACVSVLVMCSAVTACNGDTSSGSSGSSGSSSDTNSSKPDESSSGNSETPSNSESTPEESTPSGGDTATDLPRNETLYFGGLQWGTVNSWNPVGTNQNNAMAVTATPYGSRTVMFETLYMYNILDGSFTPLLADGEPQWADDQSSVTVKLKGAAKWSDGTPVTANDVQRTWDLGAEHNNSGGYGDYIESVVAVDDSTVTINAKLNAEGKPVNPLKMRDWLTGTFIAQKAWIDTLVERNGNDSQKILNDKAEDVVWSGPYTKYYADDQKVVLVRDDDYWGQDASMWGKLPVPKYLVHTIYVDNAATEVAFKAGEVDINQQFLPNVQDLWLKDGLPVSTYIDEAPYGICVTMPTAWYNMNVPVLKENTALRKAIAMAVDYDLIIANAMTNQSPTFTEVPRSIMNPTKGEQDLLNKDELKDLQWAGGDIEGAKKLLDDAGLVDTDGNGIREWNGEDIKLNACCPNGWSDWQAAMVVVADAGKSIGIDISTNYPEWDIYQTVFTNPNQTEYQIFMYSPGGASPSNPWSRALQFLGSDYVGMENNWSGNWGQYTNERADEILDQIPLTSDQTELKARYTELAQIYLTEVPSFSLMYRPDMFHIVNESVWTNFPSQDDGRNIPPLLCTDGYSIAALYELQNVN